MSLLWQEWCRLCGNTPKGLMKNISISGRPTTIQNLIVKYIPLQNMADKKYPQTVCTECNQTLKRFHLYASSCLQIQSMFELFVSDAALPDEKWYDETKIDILSKIKCQIEIKTEETNNIIIANQDIENGKIDDSAGHYDTQLNFDFPDIQESSEEDYIPIAMLDKRSSRDKKNKTKIFSDAKFKYEKKKKIKKEKMVGSEDTLLLDVDLLVKNEPGYEENVASCSPGAPTMLGEIVQNGNIEVKKEHKVRRLKSEMLTSCVKYDCYICEHNCKNWHALCNHFRDSHAARAKVMCICGKFLASRISIGRHCAKHGKVATYDCSTCAKRFLHLWELQTHLASHLPAARRPHACAQCSRGFATAQLLRHHERVHTPLEQRRQHDCHICHIKFASKSSLATHIRAVHEGLKPFVCDQCGKAFATKGILVEHSVRHSDDKPHVCRLCQKSFKTKQCLSIHEDTHSSTVYQCPHCPIRLNSRRTLRMHLFVHDEVARYQCSFCTKTFKRAKDLKNHSNLHTGRRPYSCPWCARTFANGSNCRAHKRRMHPNELANIDGETQYTGSKSDEKSEEIIEPKVIYTTIKRKAPASYLLQPNFLVPPDISEQGAQYTNRQKLQKLTIDNIVSNSDPSVNAANQQYSTDSKNVTDTRANRSLRDKPFPILSDVLTKTEVFSPGFHRQTVEINSHLLNSVHMKNDSLPSSMKKMAHLPYLPMHLANCSHSNPYYSSKDHVN